MVNCTLARSLTNAEIEAIKAYASDATFFHAIYQDRQEELAQLPVFQEFEKVAKAHRDGLDGAIGNSTLNSQSTLYSGHGRGLAIRGSLCGESNKFVGLHYRYRGYISTSSVNETAIKSFLVKRAYHGSAPTLLEFRLPQGFNALDMNTAGAYGEFEFLIGREGAFIVTEASQYAIGDVEDEVLHLVLEPLARSSAR
jgi:hypothetical protein